MQHDPGDMTSTDFKQEYTVIIRKKKYYAITSLEGNDAYLKMYQIENYTSLSTSINVQSTPSTCRLSMIGGQKVICAERGEQDSGGWGAGEKGFFNMLSGWSKDIDDGDVTMDNDGNYLYNNMLFDNIQDMKKAKYGTKIAEKCDIEPMDEIYVFGKSRREKDGDKYKMYQLFFGYISEVTKSYTADKSNPVIQISAQDHLKLLQISYMANTPAQWYNVAIAGAHYDTDFLGNIIIDDDPFDVDNNNTEIKANMYTNVFAGQYPYKIIATVAEQAGIPKKFLKKRIEQVKRVPFLRTLRQSGNMVEPYQTDAKEVLTYCSEAANKLFMEFYADEEGQLVFKIPNWTLGINRLPANNAYIDDLLTDDEKKSIKDKTFETEVTEIVTTYETVTEVISPEIKHTAKQGDTLMSLAEQYLGDSNRWKEIKDINNVTNPHWLYPGQSIIIKKGVSNTKQIAKQTPITTKKILDDASLSTVTDKYIPVIKDNEIISFVLTDNDDVANCFEITQEAGLYGSSATGNDGKLVFTRVVQDWNSILRFGMRKVQPISTPILDDVVGPILFGTMMVQKSLSQRYKATLDMIEESSIRVGNPIRLFMYDEHPYKFNVSQLGGGLEQAVFYVESISRTLKPDGVSTMQLTLSAGRVMGMESIYDKMQLLYGRYYEEYTPVEYTGPGANGTNSANGGDSAGMTYNGNLSELQNKIIKFATSFVGVPYQERGETPDGFDCSGFVQYVFNHFSQETGITLSRTTYTQINDGAEVLAKFAAPCDLIFPHAGHVGIYLGDGQMIHSPHTGDHVRIAATYGSGDGWPKYVRIKGF
jgi:LysM repeat protein